MKIIVFSLMLCFLSHFGGNVIYPVAQRKSFVFFHKPSLLIVRVSQVTWVGFFSSTVSNFYAATGNQTQGRVALDRDL